MGEHLSDIFLVINVVDRMDDGRAPLCATLPAHRGYMGGLPVFYPIFHSFLTGRAEELCAEISLFRHTSGGWESYTRLISYIILRTEPRLFSLHTRPHTDVGATAVQGTGYTQGGMVGYIQGGYTRWYIPGCTYQGIPPIPTRVYLPYPPGCTALLTAGCTALFTAGCTALIPQVPQGVPLSYLRYLRVFVAISAHLGPGVSGFKR